MQVVPVLHEAPLLRSVSQTRPQPVQVDVDEVEVSHPLALEPLVSQSANPATHAV